MTTLDELLTVGRRVRVSLSPECRPKQTKVYSHQTGEVKPWKVMNGHSPEENGAIGVIAERESNRTHPFRVEFDQPFPYRYGILAAATYAAAELTPLDEHGKEIEHPMMAGRYRR